MSFALSGAAKDAKKSKKAKKPAFRLADIKVSALLMSAQVVFMLLIVVVGGIATYFFDQNIQSVRAIGAQNERAKQVLSISSEMLRMRVDLMVAARMQQEGVANNDAAILDAAQKALEDAKASLDAVTKRFGAFRQNMPEDAEGRRLATRLISTYRPYEDDGISPMVQALEARDYTTFYYVNAEFGIPRSQDFEKSIQAFSSYIDAYERQSLETAQAQFNQALMAIAAGIGFGLILMIAVRILFARTVIRPLREAGQHFDKIAGGDLTQRITVKSRNEIGLLYEALKRMQESLTRTVTAVRSGVDEINLGSREIFMGNTDLSSRTEQQAASLQETAASMEQLAGTVKQNTENAQQADSLAKGASDVALRGGSAVTEVVRTMDQISASSGKIADIVNVIDGIAFQTNILALNAAVEAARAGEQGKGFAVVAGEVRSLAQRSAQAAKEIKTLIEESLDTIRSGARQADQAGDIMREVVGSVQGVTTIMAEISSASREQSEGIEQVNLAVAEMDGVVQQNAALVEEAAAAAGSLQDQATRLGEAVAVFRIGPREVIDMASRQAGPASLAAAGKLPRVAASSATPALQGR